MGKYQIYKNGEYYDYEKEGVEYRQKIASGEVAPPPPPPFMLAPPEPVTEQQIIDYNKLWNPYDPLYNDPEYARAHGHRSVPAYPAFNAMFPMQMPGFPKDNYSEFYYTMDRNDIRTERNIYAGDLLVSGKSSFFFNDLTPAEGAESRTWEMGGIGETLDADGNLLYTCKGNVLEGYTMYTDGSPKMPFSENMSKWVSYFPKAHYTTDEDYERMQKIWDQEKVMGDGTPYWEDVAIGYELPQTCTDGPITYMHMMYWYNIGDLSIYSRKELMDPAMRSATFRDRYGAFLDETSLHFSGRNIPGMRGVSYNDTAAKLVARVLTNFVGNKGRVSRFGWGLFPFFKELRVRDIDADMFMKVPGMEGRKCERHGSEGDTVIGRAVITDKYVNSKGEHCCEVAVWAETLDGEIIQTCPSEIVLPSRG